MPLIFQKLKPNKINFSFILTLLCLIGMFLLAWFKNVDIMATLPVVLGIFIGSKSIEKSAAVYSASKDNTCDTHAVIRELEGIDSEVPISKPKGKK